MDSFLLFIIRQDLQDLWDYWLCLFPDETGKYHSLLVDVFEMRYFRFTSTLDGPKFISKPSL